MDIFLLSLFLIAPVYAIDFGTCYTPGPSFPPADQILSKPHFAQLRTKLDSLIADILGRHDGWKTNTTSFAVQATTSKETIWDHFYTPPILGDYEDSEPSPVTGNTNFRIASISKTFTVYAILLENKIGLDDSITKYLPELLNLEDLPRDRGDWFPSFDQITIRSLASQLSGISRETGLQDLAIVIADPVAEGFPPIDPNREQPCLGNSTRRSCNASEIISVARSRPKVFEVNDRSTYSNVAFSLLGLALERTTGKPYSEIISSSILEPLGMNHTTTRKPKDSDGIIPWGPNDWRRDLDSDTPSGGIYSTTNDLSQYLRSILSSSLLPLAKTNEWLKPHSWTISGLNSAYSMPWEILRSTKLTPDGRAVDIITKGGVLDGYYSSILMIPEFGIGVTILVAGDYPALVDLREKITATLIPAVEKLIRDEIRKQYAGTWANWPNWWSTKRSGPDMNFSLKLDVDDTGPGLRVLNWSSNGTDFLPVYGRLKRMPEGTKWRARLILTSVLPKSDDGDDPDPDWSAETWRLVVVPEQRAGEEKKVFDDFCMTDVDSLMYSGVSIELFVILKDHGEAQWIFLGMGTDMFKCDERDNCVRPAGEKMRFQGFDGKFAAWKQEQAEGKAIEADAISEKLYFRGKS